MELFRVKWGCEAAADSMEGALWSNSSTRWSEFVSQLDERYLGFFLPDGGKGSRVTSSWKLGKELKWFSVEVPRQGWKVLSMIDDITEVAWKLDLAFGFRPFSAEGVQSPRVLLHEGAYGQLSAKKVPPPGELLRSVRLWKFFSEYDVHSTDFVSLMKDCELTLDDVQEQVRKFFDLDLTSQYREGQYPPYFINDKKKKEFQAAVRDLLMPMDDWLRRGQPAAEIEVVEPRGIGDTALPA